MWKSIIAVAATIAILGGCASSYPPAPQSAQLSGPDRYLIGPGDTLDIVVWRNPEVSRSVVVPPDGRINVPLVEDLPAAGMTSIELADAIEAELGRYIKDPIVTVIPGGFQGPYSRQVRVVGEAVNPQALQYRRGMTLLDVMVTVGGLTEFAAGNQATLLRTLGDERKQYSLRLSDLVRDGDVSANVEVAPGDIIIIPESLL